MQNGTSPAFFPPLTPSLPLAMFTQSLPPLFVLSSLPSLFVLSSLPPLFVLSSLPSLFVLSSLPSLFVMFSAQLKDAAVAVVDTSRNHAPKAGVPGRDSSVLVRTEGRD
eukprot:342123-Hanusia_phi.AAC.1